MSNIAVQRVGPLVRIPNVLGSLGFSPSGIDELLGSERELLSHPDGLIPFPRAVAILARCASAARCPHFGLLVGEQGGPGDLGLPGALMASAATIGQALLDFVGCQFHNSSGAVVYLARAEPGNALLGYGIYDQDLLAGGEQVYDLALAVGVNLLRQLGGPKSRPAEVLLSRRLPEDRRPYHRVFGAEVRFNQPQSALIVAPAVLELPVLGRDDSEHERLHRLVDATFESHFPDFRARVQHILRPSLLMGTDSAVAVARKLGLHVRTLNRRLQEQNTTFRELDQQVRFHVACELLDITDLQISDIAAALSYATPAAFVHAFQRWNHMSPSEWRARRPERRAGEAVPATS